MHSMAVLGILIATHKLQSTKRLSVKYVATGLPYWCPDPALLHRRGHVQPCSAPAQLHSLGLRQLYSAPPTFLSAPVPAVPCPTPSLQLCCPDLALHVSCNCLWFVRCFCSNLQVVVGLRAYSRLERQSKRFNVYGLRLQGSVYKNNVCWTVPSKYNYQV